jgi:hypothetical protein
MKKSPLFLLAIVPLLVYGNDYDEDPSYRQSPRKTTSGAQKKTPVRLLAQNNDDVYMPSSSNNDEETLYTQEYQAYPSGLTVNARYLFWTAMEDNLEYAMHGISNYSVGDPATNLVSVPVDPSPQHEGKVSKLPQKWQSGFTVGFGYACSDTPWNVDLDWTWYQNQTSASKTAIAQPTTGPFSRPTTILFWPDSLWGEFGSPVNGPPYKATARWKLNFNTLDLRLTRRIHFACDFSLNPHAGLRGAWINQSYRTSYFERRIDLQTPGAPDFVPPTNPRAFYYSTKQVVRMKNDFSGLGFRTGLDAAFHLGSGFSFYADAALALFLSTFDVSQKARFYTFTPVAGVPTSYDAIKIKEDFTTLKSQFDTSLGFKWEKNWHCERYGIEIDIGYEYQLWPDQNHMTFKFPNADSLPGQNVGLFVREGGDLALHGLTIGGSFRF